ncbi:unnamed protein product, partial [Didymodactylos carnosus]
IYTFDRVWADFKTRTAIKRVVPRPFSLNRLLVVLEEFLAYEISCDSKLLNIIGNVVDDLYAFFESRYGVEEMMYNAVYDFFTSLNIYANDLKIFDLFSHVLIGNIDLCCVYYLTVLADILDQIDWFETEDVRPFFAIIYPFLDEEGLDVLVIDYTSFTENKISKSYIYEFVIHLLLKEKEPLFQEMQYKLSVQLTQNYDMMNEMEFRSAMENIVFSADERVVSRMFRHAERHAQWDKLNGFVSMNKLAHIASYFFFNQLMDEQKGEMNERIRKEGEQRRKEDPSYAQRVSKQRVREQTGLIKYSKLKSLAVILYESKNSTDTNESKVGEENEHNNDDNNDDQQV